MSCLHVFDHDLPGRGMDCDAVAGQVRSDSAWQEVPLTRLIKLSAGLGDGHSFWEVELRGRVIGASTATEVEAARSWPHAASISVPRLRRTVALTPALRSRAWKACTLFGGVPRVAYRVSD